MSLLLKALNQAASAREAARRTQQAGPAEDVRERGDPRIAVSATTGGASLADHAPAGRMAGAAPLLAMPAYGGLWITLALAVLSAACFGYWMRGLSPARPLLSPGGTVQASAPTPLTMAAPGTIPAALQIHEAGPLQLRLDRHIETLGARTR